jgi:hypothetical protein
MKKNFKDLLVFISRKRQPIVTSCLLGGIWVGFQNCQTQDGYFPVVSTTSAIVTTGTPETDPGTALCVDGKSSDASVICNPLGDQPVDDGGDVPSVPQRRMGLIAKIYEGEANWNNINTYAQKGYEHPEKIYFSNFNVPERAFSEGFSFGENDFLKNKTGEKLIEWFSISARGFITLPDNEEAGYFELVTMSDDGVKVSVADELLIDSPNTHGSQIVCASKLIHLDKNELKKFNLDYFQGPRYHITLMSFIKRVEDPEKFVKSKECNRGTNSFAKLIEEDYKVITPSYFVLPDDV